MLLRGAIAQLVEHLNGIEGVSGSSPLSSIEKRLSRVLSFLLPQICSVTLEDRDGGL